MNLQTITENKHLELLALLDPLVDFMIANDYNYFMLAGKDGVCTRHMKGDFHDVTGMLTGMMEINKQVKGIVEYCAEAAGDVKKVSTKKR